MYQNSIPKEIEDTYSFWKIKDMLKDTCREIIASNLAKDIKLEVFVNGLSYKIKAEKGQEEC